MGSPDFSGGRASRAAGIGAAAIALAFLADPAPARITRLDITRVEPAFDGASFGEVGHFTLLTGIAYGEVDPADPHNTIIQDIALAPRNAAGKVAYSMDVAILKPADMARGNGTLLFDVVNRGHKVALGMFNLGATGGNSAAAAGDGFLQRHGFTVVWGGWQGDLLPGTIRLNAPEAHAPGGGEITGRVRKDYVLFRPASTLGLGDTTLGQGTAYESVGTENAGDALTMKAHESDAPVQVPTSDWALADCTREPFPGIPSTAHLCLKGGFDTNHIISSSIPPRVRKYSGSALRRLAISSPFCGARRATMPAIPIRSPDRCAGPWRTAPHRAGASCAASCISASTRRNPGSACSTASTCT